MGEPSVLSLANTGCMVCAILWAAAILVVTYLLLDLLDIVE